MPIPGRPAALKLVLSVPPVARLAVAPAPATPRSANGSSAVRSTRAARAGIDIEVTHQLGVFRLRILECAEVLGHISTRPEQTLLLARPQSYADGAAGFQTQRVD